VLAVLLPLVFISVGDCSYTVCFGTVHILRFAKVWPQVCFSNESVLESIQINIRDPQYTYPYMYP